jgi:glutamate synthase (NADPH) large chain
MRVCHLDTCPVGIATQTPALRERFSGRPEFVEHFFEFIATEVREILASLGLRTIADAVGRVDLLDTHEATEHWKAAGLDLRPVLVEAESEPKLPSGRRCTAKQDHGLERALDHEFLELCKPAIESGERVEASVRICNVNRTVGTLLGYEITKLHGAAGLEDDTISLTFTGSAGQSFGAFVPKGVTMRLVGDANDYLAKGLSGGRVIVAPPESSPFRAEEQIIAGNVVLYGATSGEVYLRGQVGERFCVRNSGATAVVEGVGDHGCEYMTGGVVVVLGQTGRNFAAGMSGGVAFVWDPDRQLARHLNFELVDLEELDTEDERLVIDLVSRHRDLTGSEVARRLTERFRISESATAPLGGPATEFVAAEFVKVMPRDYRRVLDATRRAIEGGTSVDEAVMAASHG